MPTNRINSLPITIKNLVAFLVCLGLYIPAVFSQNSPQVTFPANIIISTGFYQADFPSLENHLPEMLIKKVPSYEIIRKSIGLVLNEQPGKTYTTLGFRLLENKSKIAVIRGHALYISIHRKLLQKDSKHSLYPIAGLELSKFRLRLRQALMIEGQQVPKTTEIVNKRFATLAGGLGYEYRIRVLGRYVSVGIRLEKQWPLHPIQWQYDRGKKLENFKADPVKGLVTVGMARIAL